MRRAAPDRGLDTRTPEGSTDQVVAFVRDLIERRRVGPGDRLPTERGLATQIGVSRPTVRAGLRALVALGVVQSRHGSGTYISAGPPSLGSEPLSLLAALHRFTHDQMYEARRILEVEAAALAAERATAEQLASMAEEIASLFATMEDPLRFLVHDIDFHRTVAAASANPIVAAMVEMVSALYYERRRETAGRAADRDLRDAAEAHRRIYQAIRAHDAAAARRAMQEHLTLARNYQAQEPLVAAALPGRADAGRAPRRQPLRRQPVRRQPIGRSPRSS
jgi:GntR family transcriptional repressor for pyruvate dehydrogenase complex